MKIEYLILIPDSEAFCSSKKAFVDFIKVDSLLSIAGNKINYRRTPKGKELVSAKFRVDTDKVKSNNERYFLLILECDRPEHIDEFSELSDRVRSIVERISPGFTAVNTLWDGVGRIYAEKAYPIINEVENLMRRLIAKFMLITVGMNWSKDAINPELHKKIEKFDDEDPYISDLHKLDFIHLSQVLFEQKRDIPLDELDRILAKTKFTADDQEKILKYVPRSNWEKYFSALVDEQDHSLEKKWALLYKLRNKVAHNRNVKKTEFEQIKGLTNKIKEIISKATTKLGEIDINEEDRELIIHSYRSDSPSALSYVSEAAVAEYYFRCGYEVTSTQALDRRLPYDFTAKKDGNSIGVEVKSIRSSQLPILISKLLNSLKNRWMTFLEPLSATKIHYVFVLIGDDFVDLHEQVFNRIKLLKNEFGNSFEFHIGVVDENQLFSPITAPAGL